MDYTIVDADSLLFKALHHNIYGEFSDSPYVNHKAAREVADGILAETERNTGLPLKITFSGSRDRYFRRTLWPAYKANRTAPKPPGLGPLKWYLLEKYDSVTCPETWEADDVCGVLADEAVVASIDKDLLTVPGTHYNLSTGQWAEQDLTGANLWWMTQALVGDSSDGYPGMRGIGKKKAAALLSGVTELDEMWERVKWAFPSQEDALAQARLARILRPGDGSLEDGTYTLWTPEESWK